MNMSSGNIAVAGAGITGLYTAYTLMQSGFTVSLYDPDGFPASNASMVAGGMLAPYSEIEHMPPEWVAAGFAGIDMWKEEPLTAGLHTNGSLLVTHREDQYILERFKAHLPRTENWRSVNREDIKTLEPDLQEHFPTGIFLQGEAHLNPAIAIKSLLNQLKKGDVSFHKKSGNPEDMAASHDYVIDCRGMGAVDTDDTLRGVKGEIVTVSNPEISLHRPVRLMHPRYPLYVVPHANHIFAIGATNIESTDNTRVSVRSAMELLSAAYSLHPSFGEAQIVTMQAGIRPTYPDNLPRITYTGQNIIHCNGVFRHGFLLAPVMAQCVRDSIVGSDNRFISLFLGGSDHEDQSKRRRRGSGSAA